MFEQFIGVKPVEERHRIDAGRLADFLRGKIEDWRGDLVIEQFKPLEPKSPRFKQFIDLYESGQKNELKRLYFDVFR